MDSKKIALIAVLGAGVFITAIGSCAHIPEWIHAQTVKVQTPASYDFATYDQLLHQYVSHGLVDYRGMKSSPLLNQAVSELETISPEKFATNDAKLCYWINAYNLLILKLVGDKYPIKSIVDLKNAPSFTRYTVGGDVLSVKEIVEAKLFPYFQREPLAAFLICGSMQGQPPLMNHIIQPDHLKFDEEANLRIFVNDPGNARFDDVTNTFSISSYFEFYGDQISSYFDSPHALANYYMDKKVNVDSATMIQNYLDLNTALNDKALGKQGSDL